jgi:hypothetical protein
MSEKGLATKIYSRSQHSAVPGTGIVFALILILLILKTYTF